MRRRFEEEEFNSAVKQSTQHHGNMPAYCQSYPLPSHPSYKSGQAMTAVVEVGQMQHQGTRPLCGQDGLLSVARTIAASENAALAAVADGSGMVCMPNVLAAGQTTANTALKSNSSDWCAWEARVNPNLPSSLSDHGLASCETTVSRQADIVEHGKVFVGQYGGTRLMASAAEHVALGSYHSSVMTTHSTNGETQGESVGSLKIPADGTQSQTSQLSCVLSVADSIMVSGIM